MKEEHRFHFFPGYRLQRHEVLVCKPSLDSGAKIVDAKDVARHQTTSIVSQKIAAIGEAAARRQTPAQKEIDEKEMR